MSDLASFDLANGLQVTVEVPAQAGVTPAGLRPRLARAEQTLEQALTPVTSAAAEVIQKFRALPGRPDEIEVHFGVRLDAAFGAVIASSTLGTHLAVTLRWSREPAAADAAGGPAASGAAAGDDPADDPGESPPAAGPAENG